MALIWNGDWETGDRFQYGDWEYGGTFDGTPPLSQRVIIGGPIDGYSSIQGNKFAKIICAPGDQYGSSSGWRTLARQWPGSSIVTLDEGYEGWWTWATLTPPGGVGDSNVFVSGLEFHNTSDPGVIPGATMFHCYIYDTFFRVDAYWADATTRHQNFDVNFMGGYTKGAWYIWLVRYKHSHVSGDVEVWCGKQGTSLGLVAQVHGVPTMYANARTYALYGLYRGQSGVLNEVLYVDGFREYSTATEAFNYANTLIGGSAPPTPPPTVPTFSGPYSPVGDFTVGPVVGIVVPDLPYSGIIDFTVGVPVPIVPDVIPEPEPEPEPVIIEPIFGPNTYEIMRPATWTDTTEQLKDYVYGVGRMFDPIENIVRDLNGYVGWSSVVDVNRCPNDGLDWLAQFVGVQIPGGLTEEDRRQRIKNTDGWRRGTLNAVKSAPLPYLTGTKTVLLTERTPDAYAFTIATLKTETPDSDWDVTNVISNPDFFADTSDYTAVGSTLTRVTTEHNTGVASCRIVTNNAAANEGARISFTAVRSGKHTVSLYAKGSGTIRLRVTDSAGTTTLETGTGVALTSDWQRLVLTTTGNLLQGTTYRFYVETTAQSSVTYYIDSVQAESTKYVSPFFPGIRASGQGVVGTALRAQKPAGLIMTYIVIDGQTYQQLRDNHTDYQDVKDSYDDYEAARDDIPLS